MSEVSIRINVRYFGVLALYSGAKSTSVLVPEHCSLQDLLDELEQENPPAYQKLLHKKNDDEPFIRVMINDTLIHPKEFSQLLNHDDVITLLPGISGG